MKANKALWKLDEDASDLNDFEETNRSRGEAEKPKQHVVLNNLPMSSDLNLRHQYKERLLSSDRYIVKLDAKKVKKQESKKYISVLVNAGMFEILKK